MHVGFIGTGEITAAMVQGLQDQGHSILVSPRNAERAALLARLPDVAIAENAEIVATAEVVFLCLMARVVDEVLEGLPFRAGQTVLSVMVDVPLHKLRRLCAPATDISITIPLPPIAVGGCPLPVYPASPVLESLFGDRNSVLTQPSEVALNAHLGASALCSPILDQILTSVDWLAGHTGNPAAAEIYIAAMIRAYLPERAVEGELAAALAALSTEGGLNATLRAAMSPAKTSLLDGLNGFHARLGLAGKNDALR